MHFQKHDLAGKHYNWNENPDQFVFSGAPSRRMFDRYNGDQVLFIINFFGSLSEKFTPEEGRMIEHQINHYLPSDAKSEISVYNWIRNASLYATT